MKHRLISRLVLVALSLAGCAPEEVNIKDVHIIQVDSNNKIILPTPPTDLKVSAYLIYNDSSMSSFDVLNDKSKALWNTIIGAGDAEKPSTRTRIRLTGLLDGLQVQVFNGKKKVEDQILPNFAGDYDLIINDTGCDLVRVLVTRKKKTVFDNKIEFHCGE